MPFVYCSLWSVEHPSFFAFLSLTHIAWLICLMWVEVWALYRPLYDDSRWDLLIPSPMGLCNPPPFVTLGKSAKSKCRVSPVCVFNVPLLMSPMTRGGPPRVLALSPGVLSLLYLSTGHGRSPKDNHTCMLKKGLFLFISTPTEKIRHPKLFPYSSCFIHACIWYLSSPPSHLNSYLQ